MMKDMVDNRHTKLRYDWKRDIEPFIDTIQPVKGGYTPAKRGVVKLPDGTKVFVKIAVDAMTAHWLKKEIKAYKILNQTDYVHMPRLLACEDTYNAMAMEYLDDATFDEVWDESKLNAVMNAQDALKNHKDLFVGDNDFLFEDDKVLKTRWQRLLQQDNIDSINAKFAEFGVNLTFTFEQLKQLHELHEGWAMKQDTLIHEDIRGDNFGYYAKQKSGKLVDWNWLAIGDESLDTTSLFVHVYASGFDPYALYPEKYDAKMLAYLVCFWLDRILVNDEHASDREYRLRSAQAVSVKTCIQLLGRKPIR